MCQPLLVQVSVELTRLASLCSCASVSKYLCPILGVDWLSWLDSRVVMQRNSNSVRSISVPAEVIHERGEQPMVICDYIEFSLYLSVHLCYRV